MAYRNGTYIAFHANGTNVPFESDIKYYNLLKGWCGKTDDDFSFVNSHHKTSAVRDTSSKETLAKSLKERLRNSKNMVLILGPTTKFDTDWVPFEIIHAVDTFKIPIIICYTEVSTAIMNPSTLRRYWPPALAERIDNGTLNAIHIPFKKAPLSAAINQFSHNNVPLGKGLGRYSEDAYRTWGIL